MKDTLVNKLGSFQATITLATQDENRALWENLPPLRFSEAFPAVVEIVKNLASKGALQSENIKGSSEYFRTLRKQFEHTLYPLARAAYRCLKSLNRIEDAAKVDFSPSDLERARAFALAGKGEITLDLVEELAKIVPTAANYGITDTKYAQVNTLWQNYSLAIGAPVSARSKRFALGLELPSDFHAAEELFAELDDLVLQFRGTPAGDQFVDAWHHARHVIDLGHHGTKPPVATTTTTTTTTTPPGN